MSELWRVGFIDLPKPWGLFNVEGDAINFRDYLKKNYTTPESVLMTNRPWKEARSNVHDNR